jgi:hypothetical protein
MAEIKQSISMETPNLYGKVFIGDPMSVVPTSTADFKYEITKLSYGTSNIQMANEIEDKDKSFYGNKNKIKFAVSNQKSMTITQLVIVDTSPDSLFMRLRKLGHDPLNSELNKVSYLKQGVDPKTGQNIVGDLFCPEAEMRVNMDLDLGEAGTEREVEITIMELEPSVELDNTLPSPVTPIV